MKKFKLLTIILSVIMMFSTIAFATKSYGTEPEEETMQVTAAQEESAQVTATSEEDKTQETTQEEGPVNTIGATPEIYKGDLYVAFGEDNFNATSYVMDKYVDGNVFIIGNDVTITGQINGSLFVCATKVTIEKNAYVVCHTFVAAQEFNMLGVTTDLYVACGKMTFDAESVVSRDLKLATSEGILRGAVGRNANISASSLDLYENEESSFYVGGNLEYESAKEAEHINDITVKGEIKYTPETEEEGNKNIFIDFLFGAIKNIVLALVIYLVFLILAPKFIEKSKDYMSTRALLAGAIGLAFIILIPILAFIILLTQIGASVALFTAFVYIAILMIGTAVCTIALNEFITNKVETLNTKWKKLLMIIPVSLVIYIVSIIPYVGGIVSAIVFLVGNGIIILYQFDKRKK